MPKPPTISQNIYDRENKVSRVVFQQLKNPTDFELNELQDILGGFRTDTSKFVGGVGFLGDGFLVEATGTSGEVKVRAGLFLTQDRVIVQGTDVTVSGLPLPVTNSTEYVYVVVSDAYEDSGDRPELIDPITGSEKALRLSHVIEVGVTYGGTFPSDVAAEDEFVVIAKLNRRGADNSVLSSDLTDYRDRYAQTFVNSVGPDALAIISTSGTTATLEAGEVLVYGTTAAASSSTKSLTTGSLNFIYANSGGGVVSSTTRPTGLYLELYRVTVDSFGVITNIQDVRRFRPGGLAGVALAEILAARGTRDTLDERLDESLEEDGSIKACAVPRIAFRDLCVTPTSTPSLYVNVESGTLSTTSTEIDVAGAVLGPFTIPSTFPRTDLIYVNSGGSLLVETGVEAVSPSAPTHAGRVPVAEITLSPVDIAIESSNIKDVRPFLFLDTTSATTSILAKSQAIRNLSKMEDMLVEEFLASTYIDGSSTGTLSVPNSYELEAGEFVQSSFSTPAAGAPATVPSVIPLLFWNTSGVDPDDIQIEVNRGGGWETATYSHAEYFFSGGGTNSLQIRITNNSGSTVDLAGYALLYDKLVESDVASTESGLIQDPGGARLFNTDGAPYSVLAEDFAFTWYATTGSGTLSWGPAFGAGTDLTFEFVDPEDGIYTADLAQPGSLTSIADGDIVYFDVDRGTSTITLARTASSSYVARKERYRLGRRVGDVFYLFNSWLMADQDTTGYDVSVRVPIAGLPSRAWTASVTGSILDVSLANTAAPGTAVIAITPNTQVIEMHALYHEPGAYIGPGHWLIVTATNSIAGVRGSFVGNAADGGLASAVPRILAFEAVQSVQLTAYSFTPGVGGSLSIAATSGVATVLVIQRS